MSREAIFGAALFVLGGLISAQADEPARDRGEYLARAGDCVACHAVPNGQIFAGGLKMGSPIGAIYSTNITPDPESGIGRYTLQDFDRALRQGVAKDGHRLYPAMPYPSYAKLTDEDVQALYNFFMNDVPPSQQPNKYNEIPAALNFRWPMAIWNVLFNHTGPYVADKTQDAEWNRGAYLRRGPRPLRRVPHATCRDLAGKSTRCVEPQFSRRRQYRWLVSGQFARQCADRPRLLVAGRRRRIPETRPQPLRHGLRIDGRCREQ
jgi:mono/diheme cytochrome c family protein